MKRMKHTEMVANSDQSSALATCDYIQYPVRVNRRWREGLIEAFPALINHEHSLFYRNMVQYLLYSTFREEESGLLVIPATIVAKMAGAHVGENGFRALDWLESFSRDVWAITINDYVPLQQARTVIFDVPDAVIALQDLRASKDDQVWLVSGLPLSPNSRRKHAERYWEGISFITDGLDPDHPAAALATYLNNKPQTVLGKIVRSNYHRVEELYEMMPDENDIDAAWKRITRSALDLNWDRCRLMYGTSEGTARINAKGLSLHLLPREIRKAALAGCVEMDIRSAQLAIVSRLWGLPSCTEFLHESLRSGPSFWNCMLSHLNLEEAAKPALKAALYSTCFGMGVNKTKCYLAKGRITAGGRVKYAGIGEESAKAFMRHPLIREVLAGRAQRMKTFAQSGTMIDAFGRLLEVSSDRPLHSLLAIEAQSWELRLMLPIFEVVRRTQGAHLLSWLHDGVVVHHEDHRQDRRSSLLCACKSAFDSHAAGLGFATDLEQKFL